jgi:hypothetical protein
MLDSRLAKLNRSSRTALLAALVAICAVAMYQWILAPFNNSLYAAQRYSDIVEDAVRKDQLLSKSVQAKKRECDQLCLKFEQLKATCFGIGGLRQLLVDMQNIAAETGCAIYSVNVTPDKNTGSRRKKAEHTNILPESAALTVVGQYDGIIQLLKKLREYPKKVWIDSLEVRIFNARTGHLKCDIDITVYTVLGAEGDANE